MEQTIIQGGPRAPKGGFMEIRAIIGEDGEEYINVKDLSVVMQKHVWEQAVPSIQVMAFVRRLIVNLITARRA